MSSSNSQNVTTPQNVPPFDQLTPEQFREMVYRNSERHIRLEKDNHSLMLTAHSTAISLMLGFSTSSRPIEDFIGNLHSLWSTYYLAGRHTSYDSAAQERLIFRIVQLQQYGVLSRCKTNQHGPYSASTSDGVIWKDLPFLAPDMMKFWTTDCAKMSAAQRRNFAQFLASLASCGLANERLMTIALVLFHDTLETPRPLGAVDPEAAEDASRTLADLSISDLIPAVLTWLAECGRRIIRLSDEFWHEGRDEALSTGEDVSDNFRMKEQGFSPQRWISWLQRLEEINNEASEAGEMELAKLSMLCMDTMLTTLAFFGDSDTRKLFDASPNVVQYRPEAWDFLTGNVEGNS